MKRAVEWYGIILLALMPGCGRLVDWGKESFYQGQEFDNYSKMATPYVRSVTIYNQLSTTAHFDAIWLSDEVRTAFTDLHSARLAKSEEHKNAFLRRQLEENEHFITFYILSLYEIKLGAPESQWSLFLEIDGKTYHPTELKVTDLPYEYEQFFGKKWNRFKEPYQLRFSAFDVEERPIITLDTKNISLHIRSADKGNVFVWKLRDEPEHVIEEQPTILTHRQMKRKKRKEREPQEKKSCKRKRK